MNELKEPLISKAIVDSYHRKLRRAIESDVVIIGAGQFKTFIEKQYGLPVVVGTHPIPLKYLQTHDQLPFWEQVNMKDIAGHLLAESREVMESYN